MKEAILIEKNRALENDIRILQVENKKLKEKIDQYENPADMTLFYMWLDEKSKDKLKQLNKYKEVLDKIKEYIEHENFKKNILLGISEKKYTRDILNHILEMIEETK